MFRTLLSPVDGSHFSEYALPFALSIAERADAVLYVALVHVPDTFGESSAAHWEDFEAEARSREQKYLDALRGRLAKASRAKIEIHHLEGIVPETLAEEVAERNVDLVVINAHGWGYMSRAMLGSVSDYLMRHLHVPMLVAHAPANAGSEELRPVALRRILVPLDGSEPAETILQPARDLGALWQAEYTLVRVVSPPRSWLGALAEGPQVEHLKKMKDQASDYLEKIAQGMRADSLTVSTRVVVARNLASAILVEARAADCDVIAIATHGRGGLPRLILGSVADKVIRGSHTPVLVCNSSQCEYE